MLFGNREPRSLVARRRGVFSPRVQDLEIRCLLASNPVSPIELAGEPVAVPPLNPAIAAVPYGVELAGTASGGGAGFSVANVGDLTGSGYDDFVVGGPTISQANGQPNLSVGSDATAYLIFGSATTNAGSISNWLNIPQTGTGQVSGSGQIGDQRVGDLTLLGNTPTNQNNPITGHPTYPFSGIRFITSQESGSQLGASVASAGVINGQRAILIGAPGSRDGNLQNPGTGRAYLIYGGNALLNLGSTFQTIDLDNVNQNSGLNIVRFINNNQPAGRVGQSVAGIGDIYGGATNNIAIGSPGATVNGLGAAGDVYIVNGATLPLNGTIDLSRVGQANGVPGIQFTGVGAGDQAGFSVAGIGNFDQATSNTTNSQIEDFVIGAPFANGGTGAAYMVYGQTQLPTLAKTITTGTVSLNQIQLSTVGGATSNITGITILGSGVGDATGYSVASAGDFNGDGNRDFLVGSPFALGRAGRADLFYGTNINPPSTTVSLDGAFPASLSTATFTGANVGDLAGWAVGSIAQLPSQSNPNPGNPILIGAPGFAGQINGSQVPGAGSAYLLPSNMLTGKLSLASATTNQNLLAVQFTLNTPGTLVPGFLGASVGAYQPDLLGNKSPNTADGDGVPDLAIGAPGYAAPGTGGTAQRGLDGGVFFVEGAFIPLLGVPNSNANQFTSPISVDTTTQQAVYTVSATAPATVLIYVFGTATFNPLLTLDPTTVVVNGVAFPNATIAATSPVDLNGDGFPDAVITITPRSNLNLLSTTTTLTITAKTLPASLFAGQTYSSSTAITVTGGSTGGGGGGSGTGVSAIPIGLQPATTFLSHFGPDIFVPSLATLSQLSDYKPIPVAVALQGYQPPDGFAQRLFYFAHPDEKPTHQFGSSSHGGTASNGKNTLPAYVFHRELYKHNKTIEFTHKKHVIPVNLQHEQLAGPIAGVTREPAHAKTASLKPPVVKPHFYKKK